MGGASCYGNGLNIVVNVGLQKLAHSRLNVNIVRAANGRRWSGIHPWPEDIDAYLQEPLHSANKNLC